MQRSPGRPFVGRGREFAELCSALDSAVAGTGSCYLLTGAPGVGKSRLAAELVSDAETRGVLTVWARCPDHGSAAAYRPWGNIFRTLLRAGVVDPADTRLTDIAESIESLAGLVPKGKLDRARDPEQARFRLVDSTITLLDDVTRRQPLLLVFDDLHEADLSSLQLVHSVARDLQRARLLLVGTYPDAVLRLRPTFEIITGDLARESRLIPLVGFGEVETRVFVEQTTGGTAPPTAVEALHRITEGHPFFLDELLRAAVAEGRMHDDGTRDWNDLPIPDRIRSTLRRRLAPLSQTTRDVLVLAAVLGRSFDPQVLAALRGGDETDAALAEAERIEVIAVERDGSRAFTHGMIRDVLYEGMESSARAHLHAEVCAYFESQPNAGDDRPFLLAHHARLSCLPLDAPPAAIEHAVCLARSAAAIASSRLAYREATQLLAAAITLIERGGVRDDRLRCELLLEAGDAAWGAGDIDGSSAMFRRALATAREISNVDDPAGAEFFARAAIGLTGRQQRAHVVFDPEIVRYLEEALERLGDSNASLRARIEARLAYALYSLPETESRRQSLCASARARAEAGADPETLCTVYNDFRWALWSADSIEDRLRTSQRITEIATRLGDRERLIQEHAWRLVDLLELGDRARAWSELRRYAALASELRLPWYDWYVARFEALFAILEGRFDAADEWIHKGLAAAQRVNHGDALLIFGVALLCLRRLQGRLDELEPALKSFAAQYPRLAAWRYALAYTYAEQDQLDACRIEFERLATQAFADLPHDYTRLAALADMADVSVALGDAQRGALLFDLLAPYADRCVVVGYGIACLGSLARPLASLAVLLGRRDDAARLFALALATNERLGAQPHVAMTRFALGRFLQTSTAESERAQGQVEIDTARRIAESLGMAGLLRKIGRLGTTAETATVPVASAAPQATPAHIEREGDYWTIQHGGRTVRLKHIRGLSYLATLLAEPGRTFHVTELAGVDGSAGSEGLGPLLDGRAKESYRRRLQALRERQEEAEAAQDFATAAIAREEIEQLAEQLAAAVGLGGRDRPVAAGTERVRIAVTKAIRTAERRIADHDPELGRYLELTVRTGAFCSYTPLPPHS